MAGYLCPYCSAIIPLSKDTEQFQYPSFDHSNGSYLFNGSNIKYDASCLEIRFIKCPNCDEYTIHAKGMGNYVNYVDIPIKPLSFAKQFPEYIPLSIRNDYVEACSILKLSPKASATLSRRCLQGMIRDFWSIKHKTLNQEITALKGKIPTDLWDAIDGLRQLGNIGAHMEEDINLIVDIEPNEAQNLIKLIELLMNEWYINREERTQLFSNILSTNSTKQEQRKKDE